MLVSEDRKDNIRFTLHKKGHLELWARRIWIVCVLGCGEAWRGLGRLGTGAFLTAIENRLPSNLNIGISIGLAMTCILAVKGVLRMKKKSQGYS